MTADSEKLAVRATASDDLELVMPVRMGMLLLSSN